jgi:NADPH:quinone reductase-like Zn-dependent oxidoreductase
MIEQVFIMSEEAPARHRVLIADDDAAIRHGVSKLLENAGFEVSEAADGIAAPNAIQETPRVPYTPGWDLVGVVDPIGEGVSGFELGQTVAAMPISGCYAQSVCLPQRKFVPVPAGLDPSEAVAVV